MGGRRMRQFKVVGIDSLKEYMRGTEPECHRYLNKTYPNFRNRVRNGEKIERDALIVPVLPEGMKVRVVHP